MLNWIPLSPYILGFSPLPDAAPVEGIDGEWPAVCCAQAWLTSYGVVIVGDVPIEEHQRAAELARGGGA